MKEQLQDFFCDLHIHIGRASDGQPVKITASDSLNFSSIAREAAGRKGLDLIGIIDCASPSVIKDIETALQSGEMTRLTEGGLQYQDLVIIPGAEVESREDNGGQAHYLAYFPSVEILKEFSTIMDQYITNINLSSQVTGLTGSELFTIVDGLGGIFMPAHAFTPHKSFYGSCATRFTEVFSPEEWSRIPALELGLSADSSLAAHLQELEDKTFLSNSDAHSLPKIAREYNKIAMKELNFEEFRLAVNREQGRRVVENYGLDPRLGKYHRSFCPDCQQSFSGAEVVLTCPQCGLEDLVVGVRDRVLEIAGNDQTAGGATGKEETAPGNDNWQQKQSYTYQVPLLDIPGIGTKTLEKLLAEFGTEMAVLHEADKSGLTAVVKEKLTARIIRARNGHSKIKSGGGGTYGQVVG